MLIWIFLGLLVYYAGVFLPSLFLLPRIGISAYAGSRDNDPEPQVIEGRARRATRNMHENLPVFLCLAILALILPEADMESAVFGAQLFVIARMVYLPLYLFAVPYLRSAVWSVGFVGLILMAVALR